VVCQFQLRQPFLLTMISSTVHSHGSTPVFESTTLLGSRMLHTRHRQRFKAFLPVPWFLWLVDQTPVYHHLDLTICALSERHSRSGLLCDESTTFSSTTKLQIPRRILEHKDSTYNNLISRKHSRCS